MSAKNGLIEDLAKVGVQVSDIWELVNSKRSYSPAVPVLIDWLDRLDARDQSDEDEKVLEGVVRALAVSAARPRAATTMIKHFRRVDDPTGLGLRWVIGNTLSIVMDDSVFDETASLVRCRAFGTSRQMVVLGFARSTDSRAVPLLIDLLDDETVAAHAAIALGRMRAAAARPALEHHLSDPQPLVRREAKKALAKIK